MKNPTVSGCIVTHNNMRTIKDTLDTIFEYTKDVDFTLYVVDNLSTDGTPEFIKKNYPQVQVIEPMTNNGFGSGHNVVIDKINSDYHLVINPDIILKSNAIKEIVDFMEENADIGLVSPKICHPDGREQILGKRNPRIKYLFASRFRKEGELSPLLKEYSMLDKDLSVVTDIENASGCFMAFRTDLFKKIRGFDERYFMYFEDADITREVRRHKRAVYNPDTVVYHVWGRDSKTNYKLLMIHIMSMFKYFLKWKTI